MRAASGAAGAGTVEVTVETGGGVRHAGRIEVPDGATVEAGGDLALVASLFIAMRQGEALQVDGGVSDRLLRALPTVQDVLLSWDRAVHPADPWYRRVEVEAAASSGGDRGARGTACFFTAGVDSFHSALRHRDELDALVLVHGFDFPLADTGLRERLASGVRAAADGLGLPLVEVVTDLRSLGEALGVPWFDFHGAAMAAVAHALAPGFARVLVPSSLTYATLYSLGSHPLLDPLWSTDDVEVVHVGAEADRIEKLEAIAASPVARRHLRVCHENRGGAYNCGRCEKCLRTMAALRIAGLEGRFEGLPPLPLRAVAGVFVPGLGTTWRAYHHRLRETGADPWLRRAVRVALLRRDLGDTYRRWRGR